MPQYDYSEHIRAIKVGDIVEGTVVEIASDHALVNIGCKTESVLPLSEFNGPLKVDDAIKVLVLKGSQNSDYIEVSQKEVERRSQLDSIFDAYRQRKDITGTVTELIEGGYNVQLTSQYRAFMPIYLADIKKIRNPKLLIDKEVELHVRKIFHEDNEMKIIVSRRDQILNALDNARSKSFDALRIGDIVEGVITDIALYGAFVDIGGVYALLHKNELTWDRAHQQQNFFTLNKKIKCKIISLDKERKRVGLSLKQMTEDPWNNIEKRVRIGSKMAGKVTGSCASGVFVELADNLSGLIRATDISWEEKPKDFRTIFEIGEHIHVKVLDINVADKKISLGYKQLQKGPWDLIFDQYRDRVIKGTIEERTPHGLVVRLSENIRGFLHINDLSWLNHSVKLDDFNVGNAIDVTMLWIDKKRGRIRLGYNLRYKSGDRVVCHITNTNELGVFLKEDGESGEIEAFMSNNYLPNHHKRPSNSPPTSFKVGDTVHCVITSIDPVKHKIQLSARETYKHRNKGYHDQVKKYMAKPSDFGTFAFNELIGARSKK